MPNGKNDTVAQAIYLAQLEAQKGECDCRTCELLRRATGQMTDSFLAGNPMLNLGGKDNPPAPRRPKQPRATT